ncbi:hypothetical protein ACFSUK_34880 [Sphingobium scionense]
MTIHLAANIARHVRPFAPFEQVQPCPQRHDGIAQFVPQDGQKFILAPVRSLQRMGQLGQFVTLRNNLATLLIKVEEDICL